MRTSVTNRFSLWFAQMSRSCQVLVSVSLAAGLAGLGSLPAIASSNGAKPQAQVVSAKNTLPDGVYLYGQSPQPEQIGQGYFVFEVKRGTVVGALYMPRSSFDCASGTFKDDQLALTVVNSYDRTTNPFEIALDRTSNVAASGNPAFQTIGLQGFYRLNAISDNDYRILNVCKSDIRKGVTKSVGQSAD